MDDDDIMAFPLGANEYGGHGTSPGMTLMDYFAAKAMEGMLASAWNVSPEGLAKEAYVQAKAMLKARKGV